MRKIKEVTKCWMKKDEKQVTLHYRGRDEEGTLWQWQVKIDIPENHEKKGINWINLSEKGDEVWELIRALKEGLIPLSFNMVECEQRMLDAGFPRLPDEYGSQAYFRKDLIAVFGYEGGE